MLAVERASKLVNWRLGSAPTNSAPLKPSHIGWWRHNGSTCLTCSSLQGNASREWAVIYIAFGAIAFYRLPDLNEVR